ncbi:Aldehyde/histidinol dehydrogenase [Aspergillus navahoensis]
MAPGNYSFPRLVEGKIFVNNKFVTPTATATSTLYNGKITDNHIISNWEHADAAVAAAREALAGLWSKFTGLQRAKCLFKFADLREQNAEEAAYYESICSGRIIDDHGLASDRSPVDADIVRHEPIGVCGGITPWNGPLMVFVMKGAPALAVGNTVVLKPPEKSPLSSLFAASLLEKAGFPHGVFNVVTGDGSAGALVSGHMDSFNSSVEIGRKIAAAANASSMKRVTLELGGKSLVIIFPTQTYRLQSLCVAPSRVYVHESIVDQLIAGVKKEFERLGSTLGLDPQQYGTTFGPVIDKNQYERVHKYIEQAKQDATLPKASIYQDEIFGPVLYIRRFTDEEEAASVFIEDTKRIFRVTKRLQAGIVGANVLNMLFSNPPFGGYKSSGVGKELGKYALSDYSATKPSISSKSI